MTAVTPRPTRAMIQREINGVCRHMTKPDTRVFIPTNAREGGVFRARKGGADLLSRLSVNGIEVLLATGALVLVRETTSGKLYRAVPTKDRVKPPRTAREHRSAAWRAADRVFSRLDCAATPKDMPTLAESPIGWLARRRGADGKSFLSRDEVAAAERLRVDFERSQLAPGVTQNWQRFLTSGVEGGRCTSAQEREVGDGASASRARLADAPDALGPSLADVVLRVCCFLEGIETVESSMNWSRRSGKVVLKIALQRLTAFYEDVSVRDNAAIETWRAEQADSEHSGV